ncbi:MAG: hydrolase, partial [Rhodobacteraceae bacterium]|nr:hydrolase [Paracoccaceae bacterium]
MNLSALRAKLRDVVRKMSVGGDSGHDLAHADRVWTHARTIAHGEGVEVTPVLLCAAYLHDLVSVPKNHPKRSRAAMMSASAAGPVMQALGLSPKEIARARHAI